ncbi:species-specific tRNA processing [Monosporozyma unispora]|nr:species-specific tRNA processing [Kazachstania unispora]
MFKLEYDNDHCEDEEEVCSFNGSNYKSQQLYLNKFSTGVKSSNLNNPIQEHRSLNFQLDKNSHSHSVFDDDEPFVCHYCDARFRIRGYLTRHIKKHAIEKAYRCPFYKEDAPRDLRCHHSGGFSRRDTYKTHLKTRHLLYPDGVKPSERNKSFGHCAQCGEYCGSIKNWVELHIESGECKGLPQDYLRVVRHERSKNGKLKMIKTSNGHSRYISTAQSIVDPTILRNKDALEAMAIVAHKANKNNILSKYGNDKIIMDVKDFSSDSEDEQSVQQQQNVLSSTLTKTCDNTPSIMDSYGPMLSSTSTVSSSTTTIPKEGSNIPKKMKRNAVDKLLEPLGEEMPLPLDMSIFGFDHFTNSTQTPTTTSIEQTTPTDNTPSPMILLQQDLLLENNNNNNTNNANTPTEQAKTDDLLSFFANDINL